MTDVDITQNFVFQILGKKTITKFICSKTEGFSSATLRKRPLSLYPKINFSA